MARKSVASRATDLAACVTALADVLDKFLDASGVAIPELHDILLRVQELAYTTVPKEETQAYGFTFWAAQGVTAPVDTSVNGDSTTVHAGQKESE